MPPWSADDVEAMKVWAAATLKPDRAAPDVDPLMVAGGNSPALERYRTARARMAELEVAEREGQLVTVAFVTGMIDGMANLVRNAAHRMRTRFGNDVGDMWDEMVEDYVSRGAKAAERLEKKAKPDEH